MDLNKAFRLAIKNHQSGNLKEAEVLYKKVLKKQPSNVDALLMLGSIYSQIEDYELSLRYVNKALQINPSNPYIYYNLGNTHRKKGDIDEAIKCYQQAIKLKPDFADAHYNLAIVYQAKNLYDVALIHYEKALKLEPKMFDAHVNIGNILFLKKDYTKAEYHFKKALAINPSFSMAYLGLGNLYKEIELFDEAIKYYEKTLSLEPESFEALNNIANTFLIKERIDDAIVYLHKALQVKPEEAEIYYTLGNIYKDKREYDKAIAYYENALKYNNEFADAYNGIGLVLQEKNQLDRAIEYYHKALEINSNDYVVYVNLAGALNLKDSYDEAISYCEKALEIKPDCIDAYINLGIITYLKRNYEDSIKYSLKAIDIDPENADAHFNLALALLLKGDFENGWREYEWRGRLKEKVWLKFDKPIWDGSDIKGKRLFVCTEQGFGDAIQFIRYVPLIKEKGVEEVIIECYPQLKPLFETVSGVDKVIPRGEELPEFDVYCHLLSLPNIFKTNISNIPSNIPYFNINKEVIEKWNTLITGNDRIKVGLAWAGSPRHKNDRNRSIMLKLLKPVLDINDIDFYSLQVGPGSEQLKELDNEKCMIDLTNNINDFLDTAGLILNLDLVISVDTSVAHLAGALGKHVWVLLPYVPDWRWLLNREDSPWYPTMRLFRQRSSGNWDSIVQDIKEELLRYRYDFKK